MPAIQAEKCSEKTSETTGQADILPFAEKHAKYSEIAGPTSHSDPGQKQGPIGFSKAMSEPCSSHHHPIAITSLLATGSKRSLEKALSKMPDKVLREEFKLEANTHKAMLQRINAGKAKCVKRWRSLRPFLVDILWEIGRRPSTTHTLDRKNNAVRRYGPGLCRWALPLVQNNNRSCSVTIKHPVTGEVLTAAKVADLIGVGQRHARRLMKTKSSAEIFAAEGVPTVAAAVKPVPRRGWHDDWLDWHDRDEEDAYWRDFHEHFASPPVPKLKALPLPEEQLGSRAPDEEWLLIDEALRQERAVAAAYRMEEEALRDAKAALALVQSGKDIWLTIDHVLVLRHEQVKLRRENQDWEQFVSDNPYRF